MYRNFWVLITILILVSACAPSGTVTPIPIINEATTTPSPILTTTQTSIPISTPTASITPLPTIPTFTPTFDVSTILTVTPAPKAECPVINQNIQLNFNFSIYENGNLDAVNKKTLDFLNEGGSPKIIIEKIRKTKYLLADVKSEGRALEADVTGDGIPELLIAPEPYSSIFGCKDGLYQTMATYLSESSFGMDYRKVIDANKNGIPEIYLYTTECMGGKCNILDAIEWNGSKFQPIILDGVGRAGIYPEHYCDNINEPFEITLNDIDKDGLAELIVAGKIPSWPDDLLFPYREETRICKWNGQGFVFYQKKFSEPKYRFQALQDADLAANQGEYSKAFTLYERTIFDENLEWWSPWRRRYEYDKLVSNFFQSIASPTPDPTLMTDPIEYPSLASYAYYRMVILNIYTGNINDANKDYKTLQEKFGTDTYGSIYIKMAKAFWNEYQESQNMTSACAKAISFANEHPETLTPLGSNYHGFQSRWYEPEDICPFR